MDPSASMVRVNVASGLPLENETFSFLSFTTVGVAPVVILVIFQICPEKLPIGTSCTLLFFHHFLHQARFVSYPMEIVYSNPSFPQQGLKSTFE